MAERSQGGKLLIALIVILLAAAGAVYYGRHPGVGRTIDETVDVFAPDAAAFERRTSSIDQARRLVDEINARPAYERDRSE